MRYSQLEEIGKCLYGRSWKAQVADYLMIYRRRVNDWEKSRHITSFVEKQLSHLVARKKLEIAIAYVDNFFILV